MREPGGMTAGREGEPPPRDRAFGGGFVCAASARKTVPLMDRLRCRQGALISEETRAVVLGKRVSVPIQFDYRSSLLRLNVRSLGVGVP